jgi:fatty-acyl-CoA synthase
MESEGVTISAGVPTIWQALLAYMEPLGLRFTTMRKTGVGGSAMPQALIAKFMDVYQVEVRHGWGMTETTAIGTMGTLLPKTKDWTSEQKHALLAKQGRSAFGVEIKVVDDEGKTLPRDGTSQGELMVRGHWILASYYKGEKSPLIDGWFPTGDIATIDAEGTMQIRDRTKDVIKTGGEWISSIDLESAAVGHPAVAMAAVIGIKHPKWDERPLLFVVRKPGASLEKEEILEFLASKVAKWWVPDDVIFLDSLPVGGTGKVQKAELRQQYGGIFS